VPAFFGLLPRLLRIIIAVAAFPKETIDVLAKDTPPILA